MKIMIIEDDRLLEKTLELRLKDIGHEVVLAENGKEALKELEHYTHLDVLICDVLMPELSGPSFLWEMRKLIKSDHICVIMMSALSDGETFIRKLEVNYDYYLSKPFTFGELHAILNEIEQKRMSSVG
jgi:DNA-binding response OmpR family regulator